MLCYTTSGGLAKQFHPKSLNPPMARTGSIPKELLRRMEKLVPISLVLFHPPRNQESWGDLLGCCLVGGEGEERGGYSEDGAVPTTL